MKSEESSWTPVLCKTCGAPSNVDSENRVSCTHCGATEELPPNVEERVALLRSRLHSAHRALGNVNSTVKLLGMQQGFQQSALWVSALFIPSFAFLSCAANERYALGAVMALCLFLTQLVPLFMGKRLVKRHIYPLFISVSDPSQPSQALCRVCGAPLGTVKTFMVRCDYCQSENIPNTERVLSKAKELMDQTKDFRSRFGVLNIELRKHSKRLSWIVNTSFLIGFMLIMLAAFVI